MGSIVFSGTVGLKQLFGFLSNPETMDSCIDVDVDTDVTTTINTVTISLGGLLDYVCAVGCTCMHACTERANGVQFLSARMYMI